MPPQGWDIIANSNMYSHRPKNHQKSSVSQFNMINKDLICELPALVFLLDM